MTAPLRLRDLLADEPTQPAQAPAKSAPLRLSDLLAPEQPASFSDVSGGSSSVSRAPTVAEAADREGRSGKLMSALAGANQGATFGFADEAGALIGALMTGHPIKNYQTNLDYLRGVNRGAQAENPKTFLGGELAGAVASPASRALGAGEGALTLGGRIRQGARIGALGGAVAGAGNAEGGIGARTTGAVLGGTLGTIVGGALPIAGATGGTALDLLHLRPRVPITVAPAAVDATAPRLAARSGTGGITRGASRAGNVDFSPLARGAAGLYNTIGPRSTADAADELLLSAANKAGVSLSAAADATRAAGGAPITALEVFGTPAQRLGQGARGISSKAAGTIEDALEARHGGQTERILGAAERGLGQNRGNIFETADEIVQRRGANAATDYAKAYESPPISPDVKVDPKAGEGSTTLLDLFKRPSMQKALERARTIAAEEGESLPPLTKTVKQTVQRDGKLVEETVEQPIPVSVKTLHYVKLALDDMVFGARRGQGVLGESSGGTGPTALGKIQDTRHALLDVIDREAPAYGTARANFAGETALKDALANGREAVGKRMDPREIAIEFNRLSDSEKEMYRRGAIDALQQRMESAGSGANKVLRVFDTPADKARLRALFPDDASFNAFTAEMGREAQMAGTRNTVLKGSQTAEKLGAQQELTDEGLVALAQNATSPTKAVLNFTLRTLDAPRRAAMRDVADALAPRLTQGATPASGSLMELLNGLTEAERRIARRNAVRRTVAAASGATVTSSAEPR